MIATKELCLAFNYVSDCTVRQNQVVLGYLIIHFSTRSSVSERASERMSTAERASKVSSAEQVNE